MSRRGTSLHDTTGTAIAREIGSKYDDVRAVADSIVDVELVASHIDGTASTDITIVAVDLALGVASLIKQVADNIDDVGILAPISTEIQSLAADKATLDSLYADKITLDSLYADKATLDSLFADKITLDSLFADKATLDSLFADKVTLDSLVADKITLDSLYADKATLDALFASKAAIDTVGADLALGASSTVEIVSAALVDTTIQTVIDNYTDFNGVYLGASAVAPTVDLNGDPLTGGELYFNTVDADPANHIMMAYNGTTWNPAYGIDIASDAITFTNKILNDTSNNIHADTLHVEIEALENLVRGDVITVDGTSDVTLKVKKRTLTTEPVFGVMETDVVDYTIDPAGEAISVGVMKNLPNNGVAVDGSAWVVGDILYPNGSGLLTKVPVIADGNYNQPIAYVVKANPSQITLIVNVHSGHDPASLISYDNTTSGMTATNVQDAIDEVTSGTASTPSLSNVAAVYMNSATTRDPLSQDTTATTGSIPWLYVGNGLTDHVLDWSGTHPTLQVTNDNGDGSTLAASWTDTTYTLGTIVFDDSQTGDSRAYECTTAITVATGVSPTADTGNANWTRVNDQFGYDVIFKSRTAAGANIRHDSVRGVTKYVITDTTAIENTGAEFLKATGVKSFTIGTHSSMNTNTHNYVAWIKQTTRKTAGVRDPDGNIINAIDLWVSTGVYVDVGGGTSYDPATHASLCELDSADQPQIRHYNPTTGFEIVLDKGNGIAGKSITTGTKYNTAVRKALTGAISDWYMYDSYNGATKHMKLNTTVASSVGAYWNDTEPTENTFTFGNDTQINGDTRLYITYGQANSANHALKAYQGTGVIGNTIGLGLDMTVVGAFIMIKRTDSTSNWSMQDNVRGLTTALRANLSDADSVGWLTEFTETGVVLNNTGDINDTGGNYIITAYSPSYAKPIDGNKIGFDSEVKAVFADGKNVNNALITDEKTFTGLTEFDVGTGNEGERVYVRIDETGTRTVSQRPMNSGISQKDADKWGEWTDELTKTTARHNTYSSETGFVSASSEETANKAYDGFNKTSGSSLGWLTTSGTVTGWLKYSLSEKRVLQSYRFKSPTASGILSANLEAFPKDWKMQGSDDEATWVDIETVAGYVPEGDGTYNVWESLRPVANTTNYKYYRMNITLNNGSVNYVGVGELELNFAISDEPYFNTEANEVRDSSDVKIKLVELASVDVDGQGNTYGLVNYEPNKVHFQETEFHGKAKFHQATEGINQLTAMVNFDATTTPITIRESINVADVIRTTTGQYRVIFETPMDNLKYLDVGKGGVVASAGYDYLGASSSFGNKRLNSFDCGTYNYTAYANVDDVNILIFGGK